MTHSRESFPTIDPDTSGRSATALQTVLDAAASFAREGRFAEAIALIQSRLQEAPDCWPLASALADLLEASNAITDAIKTLRAFVALAPDAAEGWYRLAGLLSRIGESGAAIDAARMAVAQASEWPQAHNRLGYLLEIHAPDMALIAFGRALELAPDWNVPRRNQARLLREQGKISSAIVLLREAVRRNPDDQAAQIALAEALLQRGDYDEGWRAYEWRFDCGGRTPAYPHTRAPVWDGRQLHGQIVMVWLEQGLGDQLQFCRYLPCITALGGRVWLQAPRVLQPLLQSLGVIERFVDEGEIPEGFDLQIPLLSLPHALRAHVQHPPAAPYLAVDTTLPASVTALLSSPIGALRVGVVHASRPDHPSAARRDCPLSLLRRLADVPNVHFYSLQFGTGINAASRLQGWPLVDIGPVLGDFAQTAAIVQAMDLVITVDTAMAHLCGAIGHPVWTLLSTPCDWRWQLDGAKSAWYPSMRLYRQTHRGDWAVPIEHAARDLAALTAAHSAQRTSLISKPA